MPLIASLALTLMGLDMDDVGGDADGLKGAASGLSLKGISSSSSSSASTRTTSSTFPASNASGSGVALLGVSSGRECPLRAKL